MSGIILADEMRDELGVGPTAYWDYRQKGYVPTPIKYGPRTLGVPVEVWDEFRKDPAGWRAKYGTPLPSEVKEAEQKEDVA